MTSGMDIDDPLGFGELAPMARSLKLRVYPSRAQERLISDWLYFSHKFWNEAVTFVNERRRLRMRWLRRHPVLAKHWIDASIKGDDVDACSRWLTERLAKARKQVPIEMGHRFAKNETVENMARIFQYLSKNERLEMEDAWLLTLPRTVLDQVLQDLKKSNNKAISDRKKRNQGVWPQDKKVAGFPQHHKWTWPGSVRLQVVASKNKAYKESWGDGKLFIPGMGQIKFRDKLSLPPTPAKMLTLSRNAAGQWHVSFALAPGEGKAAKNQEKYFSEPLPIDPKTGLPTCRGLDVGMTNRSTSSCGKVSGRVRHLKRYASRMRQINKSCARKQHGSGHWKEAKRTQGRLHVKIENQRDALILQEAQDLVKDTAIVCMEDMVLAFMLQNKSLSSSAHDVALGKFKEAIRQECEKRGHLLLECDRFDASSKTCSNCLHKNDTLTLSDRRWTCSSCGLTHERDPNASVNIQWMALERAVQRVASGCTAHEIGAMLSPHRLKPELEAFIARGGLTALLDVFRPSESRTCEACILPAHLSGPEGNRADESRWGV